MKISNTITYLSLAVAIICIFVSFSDYSCTKIAYDKSKDTIKTVQIIQRPVYISDTIKVKSVTWKTKDTIIFVDHEIPCNDTAFVAQSDSIVVPTGDTLNLAFNYANRKGNFSVVYKPRPDSVITNTVFMPIKSDEPYPYGAIIGTFGIGILVGVIGALSK
jgi:hypothetical protein